jgi:YVTN family beta-propeller protein
VIDTATDKVVKEIKAGEKPRGMAIRWDGKNL